MLVKTTRFGTIEIDEKELITFPWGVPGFEELKSFVLIEDRQGPFRWLQSVVEPTVAFLVCPPEVIGLEYVIPDTKMKPIELEDKSNLLVMNIVSFNSDKRSIRFHVRSPLLFNVSARLGYQWTLEAGELQSHLLTPAGPPPEAVMD